MSVDTATLLAAPALDERARGGLVPADVATARMGATAGFLFDAGGRRAEAVPSSRGGSTNGSWALAAPSSDQDPTSG